MSLSCLQKCSSNTVYILLWQHNAMHTEPNMWLFTLLSELVFITHGENALSNKLQISYKTKIKVQNVFHQDLIFKKLMTTIIREDTNVFQQNVDF